MNNIAIGAAGNAMRPLGFEPRPCGDITQNSYFFRLTHKRSMIINLLGSKLPKNQNRQIISQTFLKCYSYFALSPYMWSEPISDCVKTHS